MPDKFDAILMIAFGGPEKPEDIRPFLDKVTLGRPIPKERIVEVAHHYELIGGRSPLNELTFRQAHGLEADLKERGYELSVYVGMRNWHPLLTETVGEMADRGVKRALGLIMAAHQCDASWQRYQRDVEEAISKTGVQLSVDYTAPLFDHPLFIEASADRIYECLMQIPPTDRESAVLVFTAHSIPTPMAAESPYVKQLTTSSRLIAERLRFDLAHHGRHDRWMLAYQSRSGRPTDPWLEPDICDVLRDLAKQGVRQVVVQPIGFLCEHVEVLYDIGIEAVEVAKEVGITLLRAKTVNDDPKFIAALADVVERHIKDGTR
ncbi:MAG TPA: ferrochelatase [Thermodesulfobacteriota bacterium]|nr:ferrochelatase [Thermodesulfobacteriota bacterium]